jgi:hypothetical protein
MTPTYFAGIGGQKCGTGWLHSYLSEHPQVCQSPIKEMHVFDSLFARDLGRDLGVWARKRVGELEEASDRVARAAASPPGPGEEPVGRPPNAMFKGFLRALPGQLEAMRELLAIASAPDQREAMQRYAGFFERRIAPGHLVFGEITPAYCVLPPEGFEAMLALYPSARLIFIMRDPLDRFWSAVRHQARIDPSFDPDSSVLGCLGDPRYLSRSDYRRTLTVLDDSVPADQTLTLFYEDLFAVGDDSTLRRITDFLGIDFDGGARDEVAHEGVGRSMPEAAETAVLHRLSDQYRYVADRFGRVPERWHARLDTL